MSVQWDDLEWDDVAPGIRRKVVHAAGFTLARFEVTPEADMPPHAHPHEQASTVLEGTGEFLLGEERRPVGPGHVVLIPGGLPHALRVPGPGAVTVLDVFAPRREDFPESGRKQGA